MNTEHARPRLSVIEGNPEVTYPENLSPRYRIREQRRWGVHDAQELEPLTLVAMLTVSAPRTMFHLEIRKFPDDFEFEVQRVMSSLTNEEVRHVFGKGCHQIERTTSSFLDTSDKVYADQCMSIIKLFEEPPCIFTHRDHLEDILIQVLDKVSPVERLFHEQGWSRFLTLRLCGPLPPHQHWIHAAVEDFKLLRRTLDE